MVNSFKQYIIEEDQIVYFTFGRLNPPTVGHGKLLNKLAQTAGRLPYKIFLSQSQDKKDNPLKYADKVKHVRKMFPKHARNILINKKITNPFFALAYLYEQGFRKVIMVAGSDRVDEYKIRLNKYNGVDSTHGFYNFNGGVQVISAGMRDADSDGPDGASGTKQRKFAAENNFTKFYEGLPTSMSNSDAKKLFNDVRKGMGLKEETEFKRHIQLESISDIREQYVKGDLYSIGEEIIITETSEVGIIATLGPNYVIVETSSGKSRQWLDRIEKIEEKTTTTQDPDIADRDGAQPKKYFAGIKNKSTKIARDQHFKKNAKKADNNPDAYKKAPGDATAETKPSKHTKRFAQMFGDTDEEIDYIDKVNDRINREKRADKIKFDAMRDRARTLQTRSTNRSTKP